MTKECHNRTRYAGTQYFCNLERGHDETDETKTGTWHKGQKIDFHHNRIITISWRPRNMHSELRP